MKRKSLLFALLMALFMPWAANAQQSLPYSYGFEDDDLSVDGWTTQNPSGLDDDNFYIGSEARTGDYGFQFCSYDDNGAHTQYLISPELSAATGVVVQFYYKTYGYSETFKVGYSTTDTNISSFTFGSEIYSTTSSWTLSDEFTFPAGTKYVAIYYYSNYRYWLYVDDFSFTVPPTCVKPMDVTATPNGQSATLTWTSDASSFDVAYSMDNTADPDDNIIASPNTTSFTMNSLTIDEDYYFWVRTNCGSDGISAWVGPVSVHIGYCVPNPTSHDGSGITGVTFGMGDYVVENGGAGTSIPATSPYYGDYTDMIGAVQAGVESTIAITTSTGNYPYTFVIWVDFDNSLSFEDSEIVYIGKCSTGAGTLEAKITVPANQALGDYRMRIYGADSYFTGFYNNGNTNWDANHDPCASGTYRHANDYTLRVLEAPSCLAPINLQVNYTGGDTATVTWDGGTATAWNVVVNGGRATRVTQNSYPMSNLNYGTTYEVKVQADCGSDWVVTSFTTDLCAPADMCELTFVLNDNYGDGWSNSVINVIDVATGNVIAAMAADNHNLYNTPTSDTKTLNVCHGRELQFVWVNGGTEWDSEASYVVTDINGEEIFSGSGAMSEPVNYTVSCTVTTCRKPTDLVVSEVEGHSATLGWTENGEATAWVVEVTDLVDVQITTWPAPTNPFEIPGLNPETRYSLRVRPVCDDVDDKWSNAITFTTDVTCHAPTNLTVTDITTTTAVINWNGTADAETYNLEYAEIPEDDAKDPYNDGEWYYYDNGSYDFSIGLGSGSSFSWGVMFPAGSFEGDALTKVSIYDMNDNSEAMTGTLTIYSDGTSAPGTEIASQDITLTGTADDWAEFDMNNLAIDPTKNVWVIFYNASGASYPAACATDENGDANGRWVEISGTWYDLANAGVSGENFMIRAQFIEYIDPSTLTWISVPGVTPPDTLTGLTPNTQYVVRVQSDCGDDDSRWIMKKFKTHDLCDAPANLSTTEVTHNGATLNWTGDQTDYNVRYRTAAVEDVVFFEGFELGIPSTWTIIDGDGDGHNWISVNDVPTVYPYYGTLDLSGWSHSGSSSATSPSFANNVGGGGEAFDSDHWLITPQLNLQGKLRFYAKSTYEDVDSYEVLLSTTSGTDTTTFTTTLQAMTGATYGSWDEVVIDLSEYAGQQGYIAIHHVSYDKYFLLIDDFTLFNETPASEWTTITSSNSNHITSPYPISGLAASTRYEWQAQGRNRNCDSDGDGEADGATEWSVSDYFTTRTDMVFATEGNWNDGANWLSGTVPAAGKDVIIEANATIPAGYTAVAGNITLEEGGSITVADGGQLQHTTTGLEVTMKKNVPAYTPGANDNYQLLAFPFGNDVEVPATWTAAEGNDFYMFDNSEPEEEWQNNKKTAIETVSAFNGYLYANREAIELSMTGLTYATNMDDVNLWVPYTDGENYSSGWYLLGNPYTCDVYLYDGQGNPLTVMFYDENGTDMPVVGGGTVKMTTLSAGPVPPMQGFFVQLSAYTRIYFKSAPAISDDSTPVAGGDDYKSVNKKVTDNKAAAKQVKVEEKVEKKMDKKMEKKTKVIFHAAPTKK